MQNGGPTVSEKDKGTWIPAEPVPDQVRDRFCRNDIEVKISINPKWDLPMSEKVKSLELWIPAKLRWMFKVLSVSE